MTSGSRETALQFQGHHTNQAYYKSGIMPPKYPEPLLVQLGGNTR